MTADIVFVLAVAASAWVVMLMGFTTASRAGRGGGISKASVFWHLMPATIAWIAWVVIR